MVDQQASYSSGGLSAQDDRQWRAQQKLEMFEAHVRRIVVQMEALRRECVIGPCHLSGLVS